MSGTDTILSYYYTISHSLPNELKLEVLAHSLSFIANDNPDQVFQLIDVLKLCSPTTSITFCSRSMAKINIILLKKIPLKSTIPVSILLTSSNEKLLKLLKLRIRKVVVGFKVLTQNICPTLKCINKLLFHTTLDYFEIDTTNLQYNIKQWFSEITHIVNSNENWVYNDLIAFPKLKCITQKTDVLPFINNTELSKFIPTNEKLKVIFNFSKMNFSIDESFLSFLNYGSKQVEFLIGDHPLILNENTAQIFHLFKGLYVATIVDNSYFWAHHDNFIPRFDLLPKLINIEVLTIKAKTLANIKLENSKISQMLLTTSNFQDTDLSKLTRLQYLEFGSTFNGYPNLISINKETFKSFGNQITYLAINSPILFDTHENEDILPLPKYLQHFTCSIDDLNKFDLSHSEHLDLLSLYLLRGLNEYDEIWDSIPKSIGSLELKYTDFNLIPSLEQPNKIYGISIDSNKFNYLELRLKISGYANIACVNTDFPNLFFEMSNLYTPGFCKWVRVNVSQDTTVDLVLDTSYFQYILLPEKDLSHVKIRSYTNSETYVQNCTIEGNILFMRN